MPLKLDYNNVSPLLITFDRDYIQENFSENSFIPIYLFAYI
jgi:hypothetical protein